MADSLVVDAGECKPVFVVGMNGSGTSMLTESLGRHPDLYAFPGETRMIPHWIDRAASFGNLDNDEDFEQFWRYVVTTSPDLAVFNNHKAPELPDNWRDYPRNVAAILDAVFRQFAARQGKTRWCEKSPNNSEHILRIASLFPHARFIHIIRDGRDCAASTNRRQFRNPRLAIFRWRQSVAETRRQGKQLGDRYIELRYEDLTTDPEPWMRKLCDFADLSFDPVVLESSMPQSAKRTDPSAGNVGKIEPNSRKFASYFNAKEIARLESISGSCLHDLGYDVDNPKGIRDIPKLEAKVIRFIDFFKANRRLRSKLSGNSDLTWGQVLRATIASIREYSSKKI